MSESLPTTFVVVDQRGEHVSGPFDTNLGAIAAALRRAAVRRGNPLVDLLARQRKRIELSLARRWHGR